MKFAIVILDGASGNPLPEYNGKTTLEQAYTPNLDMLAEAGKVGLSINVPEDMEPSSNVACTSIMGYHPRDYPIGRGALEGAALDLDLAPDELAMRLNLTNVSDDGIMVSYSADNISSADAQALADELKAKLDDETFTLHKATGFRQILVVTGHPELMDTTLAAPHNLADEPVADHLPTGPGPELILDYQERARQILAASPVNARRIVEGKLPATDVFAFWPGKCPDGMRSFSEIYSKTAGMLSGVDLLRGIAKLADIDRYQFEGVTDGADNNYTAQGEGALAMLTENDVVFIHVEAPDAEGHDGNVEGKLRAVEAIDREIISRLIEYSKSTPLRILALPDHPTPVATKRHTHDPVPFVLCGPGIKPNNGKRLTENEAKATGLVIDPGCDMMKVLLEGTD